jgi:hypothetical protein
MRKFPGINRPLLIQYKRHFSTTLTIKEMKQVLL